MKIYQRSKKRLIKPKKNNKEINTRLVANDPTQIL